MSGGAFRSFDGHGEAAGAGAATVRHYGPGGRENGGGIGRFIGYVTDAASALGASHVVTDTRGRRWSPFRSPWWLARALGLMAADRLRVPGRIHHIHVAGRGSTLRKLVLCGAARGMRCRHVLHLHDYDYSADFRTRSPRLQAAICAMFVGADAVVVLGRRDAGFVARTLGVDPRRVTILHNCVPDPGMHASAHPNPPQILFLGKLGPRKGVPELITAMADPTVRGLAWKAVLAGDGPVESYRDRLSALGLADRVRLTGWLDTEATLALRRESHILVLPSHAEGLSMALLEGLASGLSVIATPVGAHSEVLTDGKTGMLVPPGDSAALAAVLARLVKDSDFRRGLGERGRQLFLSRYSISAYITALDALYAGLGGSDRHIGNDHSPEVSRK